MAVEGFKNYMEKSHWIESCEKSQKNAIMFSCRDLVKGCR